MIVFVEFAVKEKGIWIELKIRVKAWIQECQMVQLQSGKKMGILQILFNIFLKHTVHILTSTLPLLSCYNLQFSSVQSLSHIRLFATP